MVFKYIISHFRKYCGNIKANLQEALGLDPDSIKSAFKFLKIIKIYQFNLIQIYYYVFVFVIHPILVPNTYITFLSLFSLLLSVAHNIK